MVTMVGSAAFGSEGRRDGAVLGRIDAAIATSFLDRKYPTALR